MKSFLSLAFAAALLFVGLLPAQPVSDDKSKQEAAAAKMEESDYYPLKIGTVWNYKIGETKFKLKAAKEEDVEGAKTVRVEMLGDGDKTMSFENIQITKEGVFRLGFEGNKVEPKVLILKLPAKEGESWPVNSAIGKEKLTGTFKTGAEKISVGGKEYDTIYTSSDDLNANEMKVKFKTYYAPKVGMVKQIITIGQQEVVIELEKMAEDGK